MSNFNKFKTNSFFVGGRHNKRGFTPSKGTKMSNCNCVKCKRNKSMTVSDATIEAEGLNDIFKSVGKATISFGNKVANKPVRALVIESKIGVAAASRNPRATLSNTPDLFNFQLLVKV